MLSPHAVDAAVNHTPIAAISARRFIAAPAS